MKFSDYPKYAWDINPYKANRMRQAFFMVKEMIVFDTETTGLNAENNYIIQISAVYVQNLSGTLKAIEKRYWMIKPEEPVTDEIEMLTGITNPIQYSSETMEKWTGRHKSGCH